MADRAVTINEIVDIMWLLRLLLLLLLRRRLIVHYIRMLAISESRGMMVHASVLVAGDINGCRSCTVAVDKVII